MPRVQKVIVYFKQQHFICFGVADSALPEPIRLLILADHLVTLALSKAVISGVLWAYDPNEVYFKAGLQQSSSCTCNIANLEWVFP